MDELVTKAIHNEARSRMVSNELKYLAGDRAGRSRVYLEAARQVARRRFGEMKAGKVKVRSLMAAESRASREAYRMLKDGNRGGAIAAKRRQLVCHEMVRQALDFEATLRGMKKLKSQIFASDKKLAKTRDIDIINVARYVMTNSGIGQGRPETLDPSKATSFIAKLKVYDEDKAAQFQAIIDRFPYVNGIRFADMTVDRANDVLQTVRSLWKMAGDAKMVMLDGRRQNLGDIVDELLFETSKRNLTAYQAGFSRRTTPGQKARKQLMSGINAVRRIESWCIEMDGGNPDGPFQRHIFRPIANAAARFRVANADAQKLLSDIIKPRLADWNREIDETFEFAGYTFEKKAELIGAILHTGNLSNKQKMLVGGRGEGRSWAEITDVNGQIYVNTSAWDNFFADLCERGVITKEDMDAVQAIWDLLEDQKPVAQKAYKQLWGYYFTEIEASPITTKWGEYRGGYVPAVTDSYLVAEADRNLQKEVMSQQDFLSAMPAKRPGFSQTRVENYRKPLSFDISLLSSHLQKVLKFAYIAPTAQEVAKIVTNNRFVDDMNRFDPTISKDLLSPWLKRATEQTISDGKSDWISRKLNSLRALAGMNLMAGHVVNALQQLTGLSIAAVKVNGKHLARAFYRFAESPKETVRFIQEASPFMRDRLFDRGYEYQSNIERAAAGGSLPVLDAQTLYDKAAGLMSKLEPARDWINRHGYFLQTAMQCPVDSIVWIGAYNQAIERGVSEVEAVNEADSVVRTTQSDFSPENISNIEAGSALKRAFLVFYNYFCMQANMLGERWSLAKETKEYGRLATDAVLVVWIPAVLSKAIQNVMTGVGFDEDDDDEVGAQDMIQLFLGEPIKNMVTMVPIAGSIANTAGAWAANAGVFPAQLVYGAKPYAGRIMSSPALDTLGNAGLGLLDLYKLSIGEEVNARSTARHMLDLGSVITGLPLGALKKPAGYAASVSSGDAKPEGMADIAAGLISGKASEN